MSESIWRRRFGDRHWDLILRVTGAVGLCGIALVLLVPGSAVLVWLAVVSLPANGPLSPLIPAAFEPLIMEAAKYEHPLSVTAVALAAYMLSEYVNWRLYAWALSRERLAGVASGRWVRWGIERFARAPFTTIIVFAFTPLPFWVARCLAILDRYPLGRFMAATAMGRFPRILLYAWLGAVLQVPTVALAAVLIGSVLLAVPWWRRRPEPDATSPAPAPSSTAGHG
jgi:membrane protein YqaA with SNARE-associated domain